MVFCLFLVSSCTKIVSKLFSDFCFNFFSALWKQYFSMLKREGVKCLVLGLATGYGPTSVHDDLRSLGGMVLRIRTGPISGYHSTPDALELMLKI